jgi:hypothetical protein
MYEDPGTRKQAKKGLNYVAEEFGSDFATEKYPQRSEK